MKNYIIKLTDGFVVLIKAMSAIEAVITAREDGWYNIASVEER